MRTLFTVPCSFSRIGCKVLYRIMICLCICRRLSSNQVASLASYTWTSQTAIACFHLCNFPAGFCYGYTMIVCPLNPLISFVTMFNVLPLILALHPMYCCCQLSRFRNSLADFCSGYYMKAWVLNPWICLG